MSFFYEIRSTTDTVLKRDGGFASQDAAKMAAREDAPPLAEVALDPEKGKAPGRAGSD